MAPVATPFFFYLFAAIMIIGGILVVTRKNPVHSALALIVTLLAQSSIYLMLYAPFVAGVQVILYAGGIMVLFLFVIMLVNVDRSMKEKQFNSQWVVGIIAATALGGLFVAVFTKGKSIFPDPSHGGDRNRQHAEGGHAAVRAVYVLIRDRIAIAAGGDHRSGGDGKEEDLRTAASGCWLLAFSQKVETRN